MATTVYLVMAACYLAMAAYLWKLAVNLYWRRRKKYRLPPLSWIGKFLMPLCCAYLIIQPLIFDVVNAPRRLPLRRLHISLHPGIRLLPQPELQGKDDVLERSK